ncbi:MAG: sn-glycerol-3-phosphate ABC transporter ATP-binding protein UgpC [Gammaproteobacteria bacterium]|nr:sn-glycerol-3-phosphate ABC transporter ATP-binding protein UgpC [Gammaproteobacteria bacterium]NNJ97025.1 sn-glycerol-3-phosphate ABC transporter ATP-binding protein UgpC [Gammaproteobacteria bacterium]
MASIAFNRVTKSFVEGTTVLRQFSLQVEEGEFIVLVGPSGSGKSTVLRLLAGLESVSEGEILIDGNVVNDLAPQQRNIAMVFQNYALYPHMSVRENLAFPLRMARQSKQQIDAKVSEVAQLLGLSDLLQRRPKQLSGGQKQRVAMGRALVRDPGVFLLDEPLSNLDAKLRAQIRADIAQLQSRLNKTTLYVTHDQVEAMTLGHRVGLMNHGELQQIGTPEQLYGQPQNIFVASFIGSPGMNIMASTISTHTNRIDIHIGTQELQLPIAMFGHRKTPPFNEQGYVGIRPEAFSLSKSDHSIAVNATIKSVEYLGHESLLYFGLPDTGRDYQDGVWVARIKGKMLDTADTVVELHVTAEAVYLFNSEGVNITIET